MIILLMFISALALFACVMFINGRRSRIISTTIFAILFVVSTALMTMNYSHHFGMRKVTTHTSQTIYSAAGNLPLAIYKPVGISGRDDVLVYKTNPEQKNPLHTQANEYTHSKMKFTNRVKPQLTTTETRWQFKNGFYRVLYLWSGMNGTLVKRTNVIEYPQNYLKVTTDQADQLQKKAKSSGPKLQAQAKQYVTNKVQETISKQPNTSAQQIQQVSQQAEEEFLAQVLKNK